MKEIRRLIKLCFQKLQSSDHLTKPEDRADKTHFKVVILEQIIAEQTQLIRGLAIKIDQVDSRYQREHEQWSRLNSVEKEVTARVEKATEYAEKVESRFKEIEREIHFIQTGERL